MSGPGHSVLQLRTPTQAAMHTCSEEQMEASRARVAGLRRALSREEELLREQADETQRLEALQRDLEAEAQAASRHRELLAERRSAARAAMGPINEPRGSEMNRHTLRRHHSSDVGMQFQPAVAVCRGSDTGCERAAALDGPLSLEDVKQHLRTVARLRRRVSELEGALDGREEQIGALLRELQRRTAGSVSTSLPAKVSHFEEVSALMAAYSPAAAVA